MRRDPRPRGRRPRSPANPASLQNRGFAEPDSGIPCPQRSESVGRSSAKRSTGRTSQKIRTSTTSGSNFFSCAPEGRRPAPSWLAPACRLRRLAGRLSRQQRRQVTQRGQPDAAQGRVRRRANRQLPGQALAARRHRAQAASRVRSRQALPGSRLAVKRNAPRWTLEMYNGRRRPHASGGTGTDTKSTTGSLSAAPFRAARREDRAGQTSAPQSRTANCRQIFDSRNGFLRPAARGWLHVRFRSHAASPWLNARASFLRLSASPVRKRTGQGTGRLTQLAAMAFHQELLLAEFGLGGAGRPM